MPTTIVCLLLINRRARRVSERSLLTLALIGGSPAAFLARQMFRHKTRKEPFATRLKLIAGLQAAALIRSLML